MAKPAIPKHPYRCSKLGCRHRMRLPVGTQNGVEQCPKCKRFSMNVDSCRINGKDDRGERCDCHGGKSRRMDKFAVQGGCTIVLGPHRKGQKGCAHSPYYGPEEAPADAWSSLDEPVPF